jgi:hypothetical protein
MSILLTALFVQVAVPMPAGTSTVEIPAVKQTRYCRDMLMSSSRLGAMRVCKTRAEWQRWEHCHSATRYCAPVRVAVIPDNEDLICKYLKVTGSRIAQEKICATRRQWYVMEQETQTTVRDRQNQSKIIRNGGE